MGKAYSRDLWARFVALLDAGLSASGAGRRPMVARSTATRVGADLADREALRGLAMGGDRRSARLETSASLLLSRVRDEPDIFLHELVGALSAQGIEASRSAVGTLLSRHGIARKKDPDRQRAGARGHRQSPRRLARGDENPGP